MCMCVYWTESQLYTWLEVVPIKEEEIMGWSDIQQGYTSFFFSFFQMSMYYIYNV